VNVLAGQLVAETGLFDRTDPFANMTRGETAIAGTTLDLLHARGETLHFEIFQF
jgi:hypothetical protein